MKFKPEVTSLITAQTRIASLPEVVMRLEQTLDDPRADFTDFARIISEDSALSARLLRIVNSSMYQLPRRIDSIAQAITVIGTRQLHALVQATSIVRLFQGFEELGVDMEQFWRHSIAVGIVARAIATQRRCGNVEHFYVLGLLHDVGRLVLYLERPQAMSQALELACSSDMRLVQAEQSVLGFHHAEVGGALIQGWKLPESLIEPVTYHHDPEAARSFSEEAAVVHLADLIAHAMELGSSGEPAVPTLDEAAWQRLRLRVSDLEPIVTHVDQQYRQAVDLFLPGG